ncbi:hypothetical protein TNCV_1726551 [Trichonephila clavipes]|nr:hypothetical protein TNCV_1726551 [Trichonephila clavipes]
MADITKNYNSNKPHGLSRHYCPCNPASKFRPYTNGKSLSTAPAGNHDASILGPRIMEKVGRSEKSYFLIKKPECADYN